MPFQEMNLQEFLYNGRYTLLALALFVWIAVVFVHEWIRDRAASRANQPSKAAAYPEGVLHDVLLGPTMADGGEERKDPPGGPPA